MIHEQDLKEIEAVEKILKAKLHPKVGFKCQHCGRIKLEEGIMGLNETPYVNDLCKEGVNELRLKDLQQWGKR